MSTKDSEEEYTLEAQVRYPGRIKRRIGWLTCVVSQQKSSEWWEGELSFWLTPEACEYGELAEFVEVFSLKTGSNVLKSLTANKVRKLIAKHFGVAPAKITLNKLEWTESTVKSEEASD